VAVYKSQICNGLGIKKSLLMKNSFGLKTITLCSQAKAISATVLLLRVELFNNLCMTPNPNDLAAIQSHLEICSICRE